MGGGVTTLLDPLPTLVLNMQSIKSLLAGADSRKGVPVVPPPPKIFQRVGKSGRYILLHNDKCAYISVSSYVTIVYLPLISNFISILQTLLGSSDLRWFNHNSKVQSFLPQSSTKFGSHLRPVPFILHN